MKFRCCCVCCWGVLAVDLKRSLLNNNVVIYSNVCIVNPVDDCFFGIDSKLGHWLRNYSLFTQKKKKKNTCYFLRGETSMTKKEEVIKS